MFRKSILPFSINPVLWTCLHLPGSDYMHYEAILVSITEWLTHQINTHQKHQVEVTDHDLWYKMSRVYVEKKKSTLPCISGRSTVHDDYKTDLEEHNRMVRNIQDRKLDIWTFGQNLDNYKTDLEEHNRTVRNTQDWKLDIWTFGQIGQNGQSRGNQSPTGVLGQYSAQGICMWRPLFANELGQFEQHWMFTLVRSWLLKCACSDDSSAQTWFGDFSSIGDFSSV